MKLLEGFLSKAIELLTLGDMNQIIKKSLRAAQSDPKISKDMKELEDSVKSLKKQYEEHWHKFPDTPIARMLKKRFKYDY
jgi:hypothetical protein